MAVRLEILTDATVTMNNGEQKQYEAIYPTHNGLVIGKIVCETGIFEKSCKRRFGFSKPIEKKQFTYQIFQDTGFLRDQTYTFFTGDELIAYNQKLTNGEIRNEFF
jgi:hypothetical protein